MLNTNLFFEVEESQALSVTEYNELVNSNITDLTVTVRGEITELNIWQNKFAYITLKDIEQSITTTSCFGVAMVLPNIFGIKVGEIVEILGHPGIHGKTGKHSLQIDKISKVDEGLYMQKRQDLINKLTSEGIIDPSRKRNIERIHNRVALITAVPSQAYNDFIKIFDARWGQGIIDVYKCQMQGAGADISAILALDNIDRSDIKFDCLVIARGGGSKEDLISFDSEALARKIFASKFPVVSAIGHEGDISILDLVADLRASTPSNAAEMITTPDKSYFLEQSDSSIRDILERFTSNAEEIEFESNQIYENILYAANKNITDIERENETFVKIIDAFKIENILNRGFSIITDTSNNVITEHDKLQNKDINIYLKHGKKQKYRITSI